MNLSLDTGFCLAVAEWGLEILHERFLVLWFFLEKILWYFQGLKWGWLAYISLNPPFCLFYGWVLPFLHHWDHRTSPALLPVFLTWEVLGIRLAMMRYWCLTPAEDPWWHDLGLPWFYTTGQRKTTKESDSLFSIINSVCKQGTQKTLFFCALAEDLAKAYIPRQTMFYSTSIVKRRSVCIGVCWSGW